LDGDESSPVVLISKSSVDVLFNFTTLNNTVVPDLLFKASIDDIDIDTSGAIVTQVDDKIVFTMDARLMANFTFGVYDIDFSLLAQNETEEHFVNMTLIYEQAIEDILVSFRLDKCIFSGSIEIWFILSFIGIKISIHR
jgi:hypothetical protein